MKIISENQKVTLTLGQLKRLVKESNFGGGSDEDWKGVVAKEVITDVRHNDDCAYDDILIFRDGEFTPGSGHTRSCTEFSDYANELLSEYHDKVDYEDFEGDEEDFVCQGLNKKFGGNWISGEIHGSVQGEYERVIYDSKSHKNIEYFGYDYFGIGRDYSCSENGEYICNVFVNLMDEGQTKEIIADACGCSENEVKIIKR